MSTPEEFWRGPDGSAYTKRNRVDWQTRIPFWQTILDKTKPQVILEVGCNSAWNLRALRQINPYLFLSGVDVNKTALAEARAEGLSVGEIAAVDVGDVFENGFDLTFTAGVLIHIPPSQIKQVMTSIIKSSRRYVLAVEYEAPEEQPILYRGKTGQLWKRNYGELYNAMNLSLIEKMELPQSAGFDNCTAWLFSK